MIDIEKLNDDQLRIVDKIEAEATRQGLDPRLALAIANIETGGKYQHKVGKNVLKSPAGALGVMQLMPNTAKSLGVDPLDEDQNIQGGISYLKQHYDTFKDPYKAAAAYNAGPEAKFLKTGDFEHLPEETLLYLDKLEKLYPESEFNKQVSGEQTSSLPEVKKDLPPSLTEEVPPPPPIEPKSGALVGAGAGVTAGAAETGKNLLARRRAAAAEPAKAPVSGSPGQKWSAKTGFGRGEGETVREVSEAFQRAKNKGKVSGRIPVGGTLNIHEWARQKEMAEELARRSALKEVPGQVSRALGKVPLGSTLAGAGAGLDVAETAQRLKSGDIGGAGISGLSALGQAATLIPHPVPRLGGALTALATMPADYIYQMMRENKKRKEKGLPPITTIPEEIEYDPMGNPIR
jgi:hypothetical protein